MWSVAWSRSNQQQLLLGLDKGRLAMVDLRMTGSRALLLVTGTPSSSNSGWPPGTAAAAAAVGAGAGGAPPSQPWHSLVMLEEGWGQGMGYLEQQQEERVMPEALMACPGREYGTGIGVCYCPWIVLHAAALCAPYGSPLSYTLSLVWKQGWVVTGVVLLLRSLLPEHPAVAVAAAAACRCLACFLQCSWRLLLESSTAQHLPAAATVQLARGAV